MPKSRRNHYFEIELLNQAEKKRKETKTFSTTSALLNALLEKYVKGEISFK